MSPNTCIPSPLSIHSLRRGRSATCPPFFWRKCQGWWHELVRILHLVPKLSTRGGQALGNSIRVSSAYMSVSRINRGSENSRELRSGASRRARSHAHRLCDNSRSRASNVGGLYTDGRIDFQPSEVKPKIRMFLSSRILGMVAVTKIAFQPNIGLRNYLTYFSLSCNLLLIAHCLLPHAFILFPFSSSVKIQPTIFPGSISVKFFQYSLFRK